VERDNFVSWLYNLIIPPGENLLVLGDFNFIRSHENRNKPGGDVHDMFLFNDIIGHLGLLELPIKGRAFTWSNMQKDPLLEQLDWFFTSSHWISVFPNTLVLSLAKTGSDHVPCVVNIDTDIPKASLFRFDNYWVDLPGFKECVTKSWGIGSHKKYSSAIVADKLKKLRAELKRWNVSLSKLKDLIQKCNSVILFLDTLEEQRSLYRVEFNFRAIVKSHLDELLLAECNYWKKRCTIRWMKQGEDNTKFFHAMATERYRRNSIAMLQDEEGNDVTDHQLMAGMFYKEYKARMGHSEPIFMQFDLANVLSPVDGLEELTRPFTKQEMDDVIKFMPVDRAPGPDGFNGLFLKKCWDVVKGDFYQLAADFYNENIQLSNINGSYITLVP
jgi:mannosylglycoprotein endo-beta-mannosidase